MGRVPLLPDPSQASAAGLTQHLVQGSQRPILLGGFATERARERTVRLLPKDLGEPDCFKLQSSLFSISALQRLGMGPGAYC